MHTLSLSKLLKKKFWKLPIWSIFIIVTVASAATIIIWQHTWKIQVSQPPLEFHVIEDFPEEMIVNVTQRAVINITNPQDEGIYTSLIITISGDQPLSNSNVSLRWICYGSGNVVIWDFTVGNNGEENFTETNGELVWEASPVFFGPGVKTIHELYLTFHVAGEFKVTLTVEQHK